MADADFAPVAFRMGTVFGFSPRMRYDLVVNAFVKDALSTGRLNVFYGGEMWRPLIEVKDVARAYVTALEADADLIRGQIFNLVQRNHRIAELALRVQRSLAGVDVPAELDIDYEDRMVRSYRISSGKVQRVLGFQARVSVEESVGRMVREVRRSGYTDFSHPRYYNIEWMKLLEETVDTVSRHGYVLSKPDEAGTGTEGVTRLPAQRRPAG
jgi:nucleoside-diphosphate-sugar epimerase